MAKKDYIIYLHKNREIKTLEELCSLENITSIVSGYNPMALLAYRDETGERNIDKILRQYPLNINDLLGGDVEIAAKNDLTIIEGLNEESLNNYPSQPQTQTIWVGTELAIPLSSLNRKVLIGESSNLEVNELSSNEFIISQVIALLEDDGYFPVSKTKLAFDGGSLINKFPGLTVWLWCRSLSSDVNDELEGEIINITPFINDISSTNSVSGGSFNLSLSPVTCFNNEGKWVFTKDILQYKHLGEYNTLTYSHLFNRDGSRNNFYFHNLINENDIIFIRYETLLSEVKDRLFNNEFNIDKSELPGKIYDFIGLVDFNSIAVSADGVQINIGGRDLTKLVIEDGCYFYPLDFVEGGIFSNDRNESLIDRIDGRIYSLVQEAEKTINFSLKFVFNALTNIGICSDNLFSAYGEARTKKFPTKSSEIGKQKNKVITEKSELKNQILKDIQKGSISPDYNYTFSVFESFIKQLNEENALIFQGGILVGTESTTFNNRFVDGNETPLELSSVNYLLDESRISTMYKYIKLDTVNKEDLILQEGEVLTRGIWQIIKLNIDPGLNTRILVDNSIGNENGSILNYIRKVCQEPWVEFWGDTYGDQYYFTAKIPPFNKKAVLKWIGELNILTVKQEDVIRDNFQFTQNSAYSWYHLTPQSVLEGGGDEIIWAYLKAVHFQEYANVWGERPLDIVTQYIPYYNILSKDQKYGVGYAIKQYLYDLQFLVETNCYVPFTREGQIVISGGDRRFKVGMWCRYEGTGEIFYIHSVSHSYTSATERFTTLSVERGMVERYVNKYFEIINSKIDKSIFTSLDDPNDWIEKTSGSWKVNRDIFNFFLRRQQFVKQNEDNSINFVDFEGKQNVV